MRAARMSRFEQTLRPAGTAVHPVSEKVWRVFGGRLSVRAFVELVARHEVPRKQARRDYHCLVREEGQR